MNLKTVLRANLNRTLCLRLCAGGVALLVLLTVIGLVIPAQPAAPPLTTAYDVQTSGCWQIFKDDNSRTLIQTGCGSQSGQFDAPAGTQIFVASNAGRSAFGGMVAPQPVLFALHCDEGVQVEYAKADDVTFPMRCKR